MGEEERQTSCQWLGESDAFLSQGDKLGWQSLRSFVQMPEAKPPTASAS